MPEWLKDTVFYEIYPQSFKDTNSDGIGDLNGIIEKLDYVKSLGANALWINPCFDSPFKDAGYDVRDYKKVAERYGTNEDLIHLLKKHMQGESGYCLTLCPDTPATLMNGSSNHPSMKKMNIRADMYGLQMHLKESAGILIFPV